MKQAIEFLRSKGMQVTYNGEIISPLPIGEDGIELIDELENETMTDEFYYTIIGEKLTRQYL